MASAFRQPLGGAMAGTYVLAKPWKEGIQAGLTVFGVIAEARAAGRAGQLTGHDLTRPSEVATRFGERAVSELERAAQALGATAIHELHPSVIFGLPGGVNMHSANGVIAVGFERADGLISPVCFDQLRVLVQHAPSQFAATSYDLATDFLRLLAASSLPLRYA